MASNHTKQTPHQNVEALTRDLAKPFDPAMVRWKPQKVSGNRALVIAYVDARVIQDRLDEVLGVEGWQWVFLVEGIPAVLLACFGPSILRNRPADAPWLAPEERAWLLTAGRVLRCAV